MSHGLADKFTISCPQCGKAVTVSQSHIGKKGRCPDCKSIFPITAPANVAPAGLDDLVPLDAPLQPLGGGLDPLGMPGAAGPSMWNEVPAGLAAPAAPLPSQNWPRPGSDEPQLRDDAPALNANATLANEYMKRARSDKGGTIQQLEREDSHYRFMTSWGSVIGGICTVCLALFFILLLLLIFPNCYLLALCVAMIIGGIGWIIQGMNYIAYYNWLDKGGRD